MALPGPLYAVETTDLGDPDRARRELLQLLQRAVNRLDEGVPLEVGAEPDPAVLGAHATVAEHGQRVHLVLSQDAPDRRHWALRADSRAETDTYAQPDPWLAVLAGVATATVGFLLAAWWLALGQQGVLFFAWGAAVSLVVGLAVGAMFWRRWRDRAASAATSQTAEQGAVARLHVADAVARALREDERVVRVEQR